MSMGYQRLIRIVKTGSEFDNQRISETLRKANRCKTDAGKKRAFKTLTADQRQYLARLLRESRRARHAS
jgi:hypothetical protein